MKIDRAGPDTAHKDFPTSRIPVRRGAEPPCASDHVCAERRARPPPDINHDCSAALITLRDLSRTQPRLPLSNSRRKPQQQDLTVQTLAGAPVMGAMPPNPQSSLRSSAQPWCFSASWCCERSEAWGFGGGAPMNRESDGADVSLGKAGSESASRLPA